MLSRSCGSPHLLPREDRGDEQADDDHGGAGVLLAMEREQGDFDLESYSSRGSSALAWLGCWSRFLSVRLAMTTASSAGSTGFGTCML